MRSSSPVSAYGTRTARVQRVVDRLDPVVGRDDVERAPDRRQLGLVGRVVEVVAAVPPALPERRVEHLAPASTASASVRSSSSRAAAGLALEGEHGVDRRAGPRRRPGANARWVATSSYMRTTDGRWPSWSARRIASVPAAIDGNDDGGEAALLGQRRELQRRAGDDAERALRADEQLRQLGPDRVARDADGLDQPAGRRRDAQRQQQVLNLPVTRGQHAGAARRDISPDRGPLDRGRVVREHQPAGVQLGLEPAPVDARLGGDGHRPLVDRDDLVEAAQVDHDAAVDRQARRPACPSRRPTGRPGRRCASAIAHDLGDLLLGARRDDDVGAGDRRSGGGGVQRGPVRVGDERVQTFRRGRDRVSERRDERLLRVGQCRGRRGSSSP